MKKAEEAWDTPALLPRKPAGDNYTGAQCINPYRKKPDPRDGIRKQPQWDHQKAMTVPLHLSQSMEDSGGVCLSW